MPLMPSRQIYLPTEIVVEIITYAAADDGHRQATLHACCLVSRQWYSVAIPYLYEKPRVSAGTAFKNFTDTICPTIGARKNKIQLGSLVHKLDLSGLVYHSSNSLTARLLGRVKENLEIFLAPRISFAINSLPALSKCTNIRHLDLSLVGDPIPFPDLKKAISKLRRLTTLRLPRSTSIATYDDAAATIEWPPNLQRLQFSGHYRSIPMSSFPWPRTMTTLTLKNCADLSMSSLGSLMSNPQLANLKRFIVSASNRNLQPESINAIPVFLPELASLSIPGDLVNDSFFDILSHMHPPLPLEDLEFGFPSLDANITFSTSSLITAMEYGLANLRSVGFSELFCTNQRILEDTEIDDFIHSRYSKKERRNSKSSFKNGVEKSDYTDDDDTIGVYYI
ncbi:hypothetical protein AtubIFM55763_000189 [Aspergillus tubingensis]|uniref:F-box domain-containing protein n=2 Tax=Aspergillus tubingensis TaxID=5068 RepID=A0A1L9MYH8_ASPTC|nr:F-box domain protein [Aspergillus tubingensis]OJI82069.1 hypothetical protein ASPTUDRAFT_127065 [Aspergillus tubingensis CBS 134.48]GFN17836.1 F-box domain protein [Aspergillus tubingensis]GLA64817.1 hypothetical protein AtubIFM54640_006549 [Aspergillus tubingensis]GLA67932.1 hypothetical protein AtubIFM55763_000189 [Aspergillus tubingensis]GLA83500.1 hypothetical protein AtubIFM56815_007697 [Aspergillus tubingensis]